jgi:hypothetical protein
MRIIPRPPHRRRVTETHRRKFSRHRAGSCASHRAKPPCLGPRAPTRGPSTELRSTDKGSASSGEGARGGAASSLQPPWAVRYCSR